MTKNNFHRFEKLARNSKKNGKKKQLLKSKEKIFFKGRLSPGGSIYKEQQFYDLNGKKIIEDQNGQHNVVAIM